MWPKQARVWLVLTFSFDLTHRDEEFPAAAPNFDPSNILDEVLADPIRGYEMFLMHHHGEKVARAGMKPGKVSFIS